MEDILLRVENLTTSFFSSNKKLKVINDITFNVPKGKIISIVGESGSGKSITSLSIMKLLPKKYSKIESGKIIFNGKDLNALNDKEMCKIRGSEISMIFQEPMTSLNPVMSIGKQIEEVLKLHTKLNKENRIKRIIEVLNLVKIPNPKETLKKYSFELSGGMRQRVMIAMAIVCSPKLIIADEPTTALDVTTQASILKLLKDINKTLGTSIIFITHDLSVVFNIADEVIVMYSGNILEKAKVKEFFENPKHPYSKGLVQSMPENMENGRFKSMDGSIPNMNNIPKGCAFNPRCKKCMYICKEKNPKLISLEDNRKVRCFLYEK